MRKKRKAAKGAASTRRSISRGDNWYHLVLQNLNDAVFVHATTRNSPGKFLEVNEVACRRLGYTRAELLKMSVNDIDSPEQAAHIPAIMEQLFREKRCVFETEHVTRNGQRIPVENSTHLFTLKGKPTILSISRDISERRRTEQALRDSELQYRTVIENMSDTLTVLDRDGTILFANPRATHNLGGGRPGVVSGRNIRDFLPEEQARRFIEYYRRTIESGRPFHEEVKATIQGRERWFYNRLTPFVFGGSKIPCVLSMSHEITEQKRAQEELRRSEEQFRNYINQAPYGVFVANEKGDFIVVNDAAERITGYAANELLEMNLIELIPPEDHQKAMEHFQSVADKGKAIVEVTYRTKQDERRVWTVNAVKLNDHMMLGFTHDITDIKRAQREILDYQKQLQTMSSELALAEERQRRMVATELHDGIGQMLSVCKIKMQRLLSDLRTSGQVKEIAQILDLIVRALHDSRALMFELSPPMLYELGLEAAIEWLGEQFRSRYGLTFEFHDDGQSKPLSENKRILLFQIVRELFYNVIKHARARALVAQTERQDDRYIIRVEDDGVGFSWNPEEPKETDSGFGLFSIRERLRYIGGSIDIQPRSRGGGTRVSIQAPL